MVKAYFLGPQISDERTSDFCYGLLLKLGNIPTLQFALACLFTPSTVRCPPPTGASDLIIIASSRLKPRIHEMCHRCSMKSVECRF